MGNYLKQAYEERYKQQKKETIKNNYIKIFLFKLLFQNTWNQIIKSQKAKDEQIKNLKEQIKYLYLDKTQLEIKLKGIKK